MKSPENKRWQYEAALKLYHDGYTLYNAGRKQEAFTKFKRSIEFKPDLAQAHNYMGLLLHEFGRYDEALVAYTRAIEIQPRFDHAHNNAGVTLCVLGRFDEALVAFDQAITLKPKEAVVHFNRGNVLKTLGRFQEAMVEYEYCIYAQYAVPEVTRSLLIVSAVVYDIQRREVDYAAEVVELGGNGNEDDFWLILKQEIEEEIFYHILLTKEKARRRSDGYDQVSNLVEHVLNLNPINLIFGGDFLVSIIKKRVDVKYDQHQKRNSLRIVNSLNGKTWDAESISELADELSERVTTRFAELLPQMNQKGMFAFIKYCLQKLFLFQDVGQRQLTVEDRLMWNLINGDGPNVPLEIAITPEKAVELQIQGKGHPTVPSELILKSGLIVDGKKYVHPDNPRNLLNYFAPSTIEEVEMLGYVDFS